MDVSRFVARPEPDLVVRQTVSPESGASLGVLSEARCKHCGMYFKPDTLTSLLEAAGRHLRREHGIVLETILDVKLGSERWDGLKGEA